MPADRSHDPAPEQAMPAGGRRSARGADAEAAVNAARQRMRELMSRSGGRGVTVTMILNVVADVQPGVARSTVRRWLAEDIKRGVVERVTPGFYRMRPRSDAGNRHRGRGAG
jgi:Fe2+ or Zn2+ uptake regulation protein